MLEGEGVGALTNLGRGRGKGLCGDLGRMVRRFGG